MEGSSHQRSCYADILCEDPSTPLRFAQDDRFGRLCKHFFASCIVRFRQGQAPALRLQTYQPKFTSLYIQYTTKSRPCEAGESAKNAHWFLTLTKKFIRATITKMQKGAKFHDERNVRLDFACSFCDCPVRGCCNFDAGVCLRFLFLRKIKTLNR